MNWNRIDPTLLYPPFRRLVESLLLESEANGTSFWPIAGYRSYEQQAVLYAQGRITEGKVVTMAKPGQSAHNFGLAVDVCLDKDAAREGLQPDWSGSYTPLKMLCEARGLVWGGTWVFKDLPHIQLPHFVTSSDLAPLRDLYEAKGLQGVWAYLDEQSSK